MIASRLPVSNALVILLDTLDHQIARTNTFTSGVFAFHSVGDETHRLRVLRIGYASPTEWKANMFDFYRRFVLNSQAKLEQSRSMFPGIRTFQTWLEGNRERFAAILA